MSRIPSMLLAVLTALAAVPDALARADQTLFDFAPGFNLASVEARDAKVALVAGPSGAGLGVATGQKAPWPGITLKLPAAQRDLSAFDHLAMDLTNVGTGAVEVRCRVDGTPPGEKRLSTEESLRLEPGQTRTFTVALKRRLPPALASKLFGMRGFPGGVEANREIDVRHVEQLTLFVAKPSTEHAFEVRRVRAAGTAANYAWLDRDEKQLFPLIDRYGQFLHKQWPGKILSDECLAKRKAEEAAELAAHPGPLDWDQYGGWKAGPNLHASGFFRVEKHEGKWWLVDPEGRLFWSHGTDCVGPGGETTPISDRTHWFAELPGRDSPWGRFYGRGNWAPHNYYEGKSYETYSFNGANLLRKYGPDFADLSAELAHRRLRSWAMNTIGNWSDRSVYQRRKTPYVATVGSGRKPLQGSTGYWGKFPDVFDPSFARSVDRSMQAERGASVGDPWCLGYFVDNELGWGEDLSLAEATLMSPPDQAAKRVFLDDLRAKYASIDKLNAAWGTDYASWDALGEARKAPDRKRAHDDLALFATKTAEQYFRQCREAVKRAAPEQLYLGCRFAWVNDRAVRAAAKYCDVLSFNIYRRTVTELRLPQGVDKPVIVGEFHFGALDRGMFHTGLVKTADQADRAAHYTAYVRGALAHPAFIGTHWFQYIDQPTTGRGDGENYQIGLVDICDTPYPETIRAVRELGTTMYRYRLDAR